MNENGYPVRKTMDANDLSADTPKGTDTAWELRDTEGGNCDGGVAAGDCPHECALAYVCAPSQKFRLLYSASDALSHGTLFEELYKPMGVYGNE